jgi:hypothetical protein
MSTTAPERLHALLPAIYRVRDHQRGEPLRALLGVVETEFDRIEDDIERLYDNWFIETCEEWVVPYIGGLLNVRPIRSVESARVSLRGYVAHTLAYRRRKGTAMVLEQLARDTTGWAARAVEFFARLATTQHLNHVWLSPPATVAVRDAAAAQLVDSAFDSASHFADVRSIALGRGRHNIPNVGLFLWRLQSYPLGRVDDKVRDLVTAKDCGALFTFSPLGLKTPLFNAPRTEETIAHLAEEHNVPGVLRRLELRRELERVRRGRNSPPLRFMTAERPALRIYVRTASGLQQVPPEDIYICDIPEEIETASPPRLAVAVDPEGGRMAFPPALKPKQVLVTYSYGFSGDLGGGPYDRNGTVDNAFRSSSVWQVGVAHLEFEPGIADKIYGSLAEAVAEWHKQPPGTRGVIAIMDSVTEASLVPNLEIRVPERSQLLIVAADWPLQELPESSGARERKPGVFDASRVRPHYHGRLVLRGTAPADSAARGSAALNGLLLEGDVTVEAGNLGRLEISHCTVVPPRSGISLAGGNGRLELVLTRSIVGPIALAKPLHGLSLTDCIVDAGASDVPAIDAGGSPLAMERCTVFGKCSAERLEVSNSIVTGKLDADRRQQGCVRFSFVRDGSLAPKKYRCQPDMEIQRLVARAADAARKAGRALSETERAFVRTQVIAALEPTFTSAAYGDPGYAQLERSCPRVIRTGAEDGSEMGAFSFLMQPQREQNLRTALDEYLRLGLEAGLIYVN